MAAIEGLGRIGFQAENPKPGHNYGLTRLASREIRTSKLPTDANVANLRNLILQEKRFFGLPNRQQDPAAEKAIKAEIKSFWQEQEDRNKFNLYEREKLRNLLIETRNRLHRHEITQDTANAIRREVKSTTGRLDSLNQVLPLGNTEITTLPRGASLVSLETPALGRLAVRVVTLDARSDSEKTEQKGVTPTIFIPPWSADYQSIGVLTMPLAVLSNSPVVMVSLPEHYSSIRPGDWTERLKKAGNFSLHAEMVVELVKKLGFNQINLGGISAGGMIALAVAERLASGQDNITVNNLDVINTFGFDSKRGSKLVLDFTLRSFLQTMGDKDFNRRFLVVQRGLGDFIGTGSFYTAFNFLTQKLFTTENLAKIKTTGRFRMFFGDKDVVASSKAGEKTKAELDQVDPTNKAEVKIVKGGNHGMMTSKAGFFADAMVGNREIPAMVDINELPSTLADLIAEKYLR